MPYGTFAPETKSGVNFFAYQSRGYTNKWIQNFLINRTQQMVVEGQHLYTGAVTSRLWPCSHTIPDLHDLGDCIKSTIHLVADDTILYNTIKTATDSTHLQDDIRHQNVWILEWEGKWQMAFNEAKCHQLIITKKRNKISTSYMLHDQTLDKVTSAKYLGVKITEILHCIYRQLQPRPTKWAPSPTETSRDAQHVKYKVIYMLYIVVQITWNVFNLYF